MTDKTDSLKRVKVSLKGGGIYFLSFVIPLLILLVIFYEKHIYPFGDYYFLVGDAIGQYVPFLKGFYNKLTEGQGLEYTWNMGLGNGYGALYAYYLASPANWLLVLVKPEHVVDIIEIMLVLKLALCGTTFSYYLSRKFNAKNLLIVVVSVCYALSSYMINYCSNIIWLDCLVLFPVVMLGLEQLYQEGRCRLYFFSLACTIISNYYMAIIVCIFMVIRFGALLLFDDRHTTKQERLLKTKQFIIYSLLAGGAAAMVILPAISALGGTESGDMNFPEKIKIYNSLSDLAVRAFINAPKNIRDYFPNLYCSVIVLLLIPMYMCNPKISVKRKIRNVALAALMLISFEVNILDYVWHGFHFTNSFFARNSFIYIFLVLVMAYESAANIKELPDRYFVGCIIGVILYILALWKLKIGREASYFEERTVYQTLTFVVVYIAVLLFCRGFKGKRYLVSLILLFAVSYELYMNSWEAVYAMNTRSYLLDDNTAVAELTDRAKNEEKGGFFRIEKESERTANDGEWDNYPNCSVFSSVASAGVGNFYKCMGLEKDINYYTWYGHTPLISSMLGVKYIISENELENENYDLFFRSEFLQGNTDSPVEDTLPKEKTTIYMYQNRYALPLGFMVPSDLEDYINTDEEDSFEVLNSLYRGITGSHDSMFHKLTVENTEERHTFTVDSESKVYFKSNSRPYMISAEIEGVDGNREDKRFIYMMNGYISELGVLKKGDMVSMSVVGYEPGDYEIYAYSYNEEAFKKAYEALSRQVMETDAFGDTYVRGSIEAEENGLLFTSIPYDKGWRLYVDGKRVKVHSFKDAFVSVYLDKGTHVIELKYDMPGRNIGIVISILSVVIYTILQLRERKSMRKSIRKNR